MDPTESAASLGWFESRMTAQLAQMSPTEQRLAQAISVQKDRAVLASAAQIADLAGTSDATLLRRMCGLGYQSLTELREEVLADLTGSTAPSPRCAIRLDWPGSAQVGADLSFSLPPDRCRILPLDPDVNPKEA